MVERAVQLDLFSIIFRFPLHKYALTADISKMCTHTNTKQCMQQLAVEAENKYSTVSCIILNDFYVDDLTGAETKEKAIKIRDKVTTKPMVSISRSTT